MTMTIQKPKTVAIAYDKDGNEYDRLYCWETGQSMANQGYVVKAIADESEYWTKERQQDLYDHELRLFRDCFGRDHYFEEKK